MIVKWYKVEGSGSMFFGSFEHHLDHKGRLFIPAKFRELLQDSLSLYITKGFDGCLAVYTEEEFAPRLAAFRSMSFNHADTRSHLRINFASIDKVEIDGQGRLPIPARLLQREGIGQDVVIVGVLDHFEIWGRNRWSAYYEEGYTRDEEIAEHLDEGKKES